jgi:mono/diheme cytochrome c family protein
MKLALTFVLTCSAFAADMDSTRGAALFESQGCVQCHSVNGRGAHTAPDLGRALDRAYTPGALAGTMWNHAPTMWSAILKMGVARPIVDEQEAGDLFAFFYSVRFFDRPGDAGRGKNVFTTRGCMNCHGVGAAGSSGALPVSAWTSLDDPVTLASAMWNHSPQMQRETSRSKTRWPELTGQDLTDLLVFIRNSPGKRTAAEHFQISSSQVEGEKLFQSKGCVACHGPGKISLPERLSGLTLTGVAAQMWDHAPRMKAPPIHLDAEEMRQLLSYIWARPFFEESGNITRGRRAFAAKHCLTCHDDPKSGAPHLTARAGGFSGITMVSDLWKHGPAMLDKMNAQGIVWPRFRAGEMSDLIAYLNSGERK